MKYLYILTINPSRPINQEVLLGRLNKALDWVQPMPNVFLIESTSDPKTWNGRLKPVMKNNLFLLIQIKPGVRTGWLPKWAWEWLKGKVQ